MNKALEEYLEWYIAKQRRKGWVEGWIKGEREAKLETVENMVNDGITLEKALECVNLDRETYEKYRKKE